MRTSMPTPWRLALGLVIGASAVAFVQPSGEKPAVQSTSQPALRPGPESGVPGVLPPGFPAEHRLLAELAGSYNVNVAIFTADPAKDPVEVKGVAVRKMGVGGRFLQDTVEVLSADKPFTFETAIGFNPEGKDGERFELCRLSTAAFPMTVERGAFESSSKTFTFRGEYAADGKIAKTRTVLRLDAHHLQTFEIYIAYEAGGKVVEPEHKAMTLEYVRVP